MSVPPPPPLLNLNKMVLVKTNVNEKILQNSE